MKSGVKFPILRFYEWEGDWVSLGYFQSLKEARGAWGEGLSYVRRWTGGGIVDHRYDATYSLVIPGAEPLARLRGGESYCLIHRALQGVLLDGGVALFGDGKGFGG